MKGLENSWFLTALIISNAVALILLLLSHRSQRIVRFLFFVLFAWACWMNWKTAIVDPQAYQEYAQLSLLPFYTDFIKGWFHDNTLLVVGAIATCQGLIALSMWLREWILKSGFVGGIVFLSAILPLGVGAGFPSTFIAAVAMILCWRKGKNDFLWKNERRK